MPDRYREKGEGRRVGPQEKAEEPDLCNGVEKNGLPMKGLEPCNRSLRGGKKGNGVSG